MESQLHRPTHGHGYEENPQTHTGGLHSVMEGDQVDHDHSGEKKSVLKKVKDKAKRIKDTITKHGHGKHDENVSEEDDEEEEEVGNERRINGGTIHESTVIRSTNLPRQIDMNFPKAEEMSTPPPLKKMERELERPTTIEKTDASYPMNMPNIQREKDASYPISTPNIQREKDASYPITNTPKIQSEKDASYPPKIQTEEANLGDQRVKIGPPMGLEEDPHSPKSQSHGGQMPPSNYQSKVVDPTGEGGKEADVTPLISRFDKLNVIDESEPNTEPEQRPYTGSHDQFSPQPIPTKDEFKPEPNPEVVNSSKPDDTIAGKLSSATYAMADKAVSAKNMVASKLGYGGQETQTLEETQNSPKKPVMESAAEYVYPIYEKVAGAGTAVLSPIYEKVAGAGTAVLSKVQGGGGGGITERHEGDMAKKGTDKGVTVTEYLSEKFRPGDEDKALSEVITDVLHKKKEGMQGPVGKVTESDDVAMSLGTGLERKREGEDAFAAGSESSGGGVVERVKDAVGSWIGKSTGVMQTTQDATAKAYVSDEGSAPAGLVGIGHGSEATGGEKPRLEEPGY